MAMRICAAGSSPAAGTIIALLLAASACSQSTAGPAYCAPESANGECAGSSESIRFDGVASTAPDASGSRIRITWAQARHLDGSPLSTRYRVYISQRKGRALDSKPVLETEPDATFAWVQVTSTVGKVFVVVRAVNETGAEDANLTESAVPLTPDQTSPVFNGLESIAPSPNQGVTLRWVPANDDLTPTAGLTYAVYFGTNGIDFSTPIAVSDFGATSITLTNQGLPGAKKFYAVRALDAAGNRDINTLSRAALIGPNSKPPSFAGCSEVIAQGARSALVRWSPASDDLSAQENLKYEIFTASGQTPIDYSKPSLTVVGVTSARLAVAPGQETSVVCRVRDESGNTDSNEQKLKVVPSSDIVPPTFQGIESFAFDAAKRTMELRWAPASDGETRASDIVYEVYTGTEPGKEDFSTPYAVSPPGATSMVLNDLPSATKLYFVVRARDGGWNRDTNTSEVSGVTNVSFAGDVQPIFTMSCAVVGCHVPGLRPGDLVLSPGFALKEMLNVDAAQRPPGTTSAMKRVLPGDPSNSYLVRKILAETGKYAAAPMPALNTGNTLSEREKQLIVDWIAQGAGSN